MVPKAEWPNYQIRQLGSSIPGTSRDVSEHLTKSFKPVSAVSVAVSSSSLPIDDFIAFVKMLSTPSLGIIIRRFPAKIDTYTTRIQFDPLHNISAFRVPRFSEAFSYQGLYSQLFIFFVSYVPAQ
jgi:hypothetical protein